MAGSSTTNSPAPPDGSGFLTAASPCLSSTVPVADSPHGQAGGFSTTKSTVLFMPPATLAGAFKDADGDALSVEVSAQPSSGKGSVTPLPGGGLQFIPPYKVTGKSVFQVNARDSSGLASGSVPITVDVLGGSMGPGWWQGRSWGHRCIAKATAMRAPCCCLGWVD